jgi:hypothetical protein
MSDDPELALILKIIWRMIVVTVAFCAAIVAAGAVLATAIGHDLSVAVDSGSANGLEHQALSGFFLVLAFASISFVPWAIGTIIAELMQIRSVFYHLGLGALCGAAATILHPMNDPRTLQVALATGLVAGGVYWIIAGRRAGDWWPRHVEPLYRTSSGPVPPPPPPPLV